MKSYESEPISFWIARHGEASNAIDRRYGGIADFPLSSNGQQQAIELAQNAETCGIKHVITSPLRRARQTAEIVASRLSEHEIHVIEELQEWNSYGVLTGLRPNEAYALFPEIMQSVNGRPENPGTLILGSESADEFRLRVGKAFSIVIRLITELKPSNCLLVGHGKFLQVLTSSVLRATGEMSYEPAAMYRLEYTDENALICS